jgi:hypothetical protein
VNVIFAPVSPVELRAKVSVFVNLFMKADALEADARHSDRRTWEAEVSLTEREADTRAILASARDVRVDAVGGSGPAGVRNPLAPTSPCWARSRDHHLPRNRRPSPSKRIAGKSWPYTVTGESSPWS